MNDNNNNPPIRSLFRQPDPFDGSHSKFQGWLRQIKIFHRGNHITSDTDRILSTLSFMTEGSAATWANKYSDDHLDQEDIGAWENFLQNLTAAFCDHTIDRKAREKLENFPQGHMTIDEFLNNFETFLSDANIPYDSERIRLLERNVHPNIIDAVYMSGNLPTTYFDYKHRLLAIGRLWEQRQQQRKQSQSLSSSQTIDPTPPTPVSSDSTVINAPISTPILTPILPSHPQILPRPDQPTSSAITYKGHGQPMDLDTLKKTNRCFNCGRIGHFRRDCPDKPKHIDIYRLLLEFSDKEKEEFVHTLQDDYLTPK